MSLHDCHIHPLGMEMVFHCCEQSAGVVVMLIALRLQTDMRVWGMVSGWIVHAASLRHDYVYFSCLSESHSSCTCIFSNHFCEASSMMNTRNWCEKNAAGVVTDSGFLLRSEIGFFSRTQNQSESRTLRLLGNKTCLMSHDFHESCSHDALVSDCCFCCILQLLNSRHTSPSVKHGCPVRNRIRRRG